MKFSAKQIAELLGGQIEGNEDVSVNNISKIEEGEPETLSFLANPKYVKYIYTTKASIVIVNKDFSPEKSLQTTLIRVDDSYHSFAKFLTYVEKLTQKKEETGIAAQSYVHETAVIGEKAYIGHFSYIGRNVKIGNNVKIYPQVYICDNVTIGDNSVLAAGVKVYHNCVIGNDCIIHAGTVIGSDGFGFAPSQNKMFQKVPQTGNVILENNVEIGSNTTVDRATIGSTILRNGVKLDNLIQIAHNVEIGENTVIAAQSGISGSTKTGKNCMFGGQIGIIGHVKIADGVKIAAQSGVGSSIKEEGKMVQGSPASPIRSHHKSLVFFRKLPEMNSKITELEKEIKELKRLLNHKI